MAFTPKDWKDLPNHSTPITAAALEDLETRVTDYADTLPLGDTFNNTYNVDLDPGVATDQAIDVWSSEADPGSVTDWGAIINALIAAGERDLFLGKHDFPCTTPITAATDGTHRLARLTGAGGRDTAGAPSTRLIWKSAGTDTLLDATGVSDIRMEGIAFGYDSATYTGDLTKIDSGSVVDCSFTSLAPAGQQANSLISLNGADGVRFESIRLSGAQALVRGHEDGHTGDSRNISFEDVSAGEFADFAFCNPGLRWRLIDVRCDFASAGASAVGLGADVGDAPEDPFHGQFVHIVLEHCTFNADGTGQYDIYQPDFSPWLFSARDCTGGNADTNPPWFFNGPGDVMIERLRFGDTAGQAPIDVGDVASEPNSQKNTVRISQIRTSIPTYLEIDSVANWGYGHAEVQIDRITHVSSNIGHRPHVQDVGGPERLIKRDPLATVAVHGGYSAPSGFIGTGDWAYTRVGLIYCNTANGASPAGLALDVTFDAPIYTTFSSSLRNQQPVIHVFPQAVGTGSWDDVDAAFAAQPYAWTDQPDSDPTTPTSRFVIGFVNEVASGKKFVLGYRVIFL